jgi:CheY-like chemotaxis protein
MARVRLIHWNPEEAASGVRALVRSGHQVDSARLEPAALKALKSNPPDVILIDLSRSPSQGRDLGVLLRKTRSTRSVPLVFVGGEPGKLKRIVELLPDAVYTEWSRIRGAVTRALRGRSGDPIVPDSTFAAYAGAPLAKKLGIKPGSVVALVGAPEGFENRIGGLPADVTIRRGARGRCDLAIWFARSRSDVVRRVGRLGEFAGSGGLWIAWPKRASGVRSDLTQKAVREIGLNSGLVDYKVCSIDDTWSGLRFTRRERRKRV